MFKQIIIEIFNSDGELKETFMSDEIYQKMPSVDNLIASLQIVKDKFGSGDTKISVSLKELKVG